MTGGGAGTGSPMVLRAAFIRLTTRNADLRSAMRHLLFKEKLLTEGAAAAVLAAVVEGKITGGGKVVGVISGGNVDPQAFN